MQTYNRFDHIDAAFLNSTADLETLIATHKLVEQVLGYPLPVNEQEAIAFAQAAINAIN